MSASAQVLGCSLPKFVASILLASLYFFLPQPITAQTMIGQDWCFGFDCAQSWTLINDSNATPSITGVVTSVHFSPGYTQDQDWNIDIRPDPGLNWVLKNLHGVANSNGAVETEINTLDSLDFSSFFPVTMPVTAHGWWCQDSGHDDKAELHPIISLFGGTYDEFSFLVAQDVSGRFVTNSDIIEQLDLHCCSPEGSAPAPIIDLARAGSFSRQLNNSTGILTERAWVDSPLPSGSAAQLHSALGTTATVELSSPNRALLTVHVKPAQFFRGGGALSGPGHLTAPAPSSPPGSPFYLAKFLRANGGLLIEDVNYSLETQPSGVQIARAKIKLTVDAVPADGSKQPLSYSRWRWFQNQDVAHAQEKEITAGVHEVSFELDYSPALGYVTNSDLDISVVGSTRPTAWTPGDGVTTGPWLRSFVADWRDYYFTPSMLGPILSEYANHGQSQALNRGNDCGTGWDLRTTTSIFPGASSTFTYSVKPRTDPAGNPVSVAAEQVVPAGGSVVVSGISFKSDPADPYHVLADYGDTDWQGEALHGWVHKNQSSFTVAATLKTGLGELLTQNTDIPAPVCQGVIYEGEKQIRGMKITMPAYFPNPPDPQMQAVERVLVSVVEASRQGLIATVVAPGLVAVPSAAPPAMTTEQRPQAVHQAAPSAVAPSSSALLATIQVEWTRKKYASGLGRLGHPESWYNNLPSQWRPVADAYLKRLSGATLTAAEAELLESVGKQAANLPGFRSEPAAKPFTGPFVVRGLITDDVLRSPAGGQQGPPPSLQPH